MHLIGFFFDTISLQDPALLEWGLVGGMVKTEYGVAVYDDNNYYYNNNNNKSVRGS